MSAKGLRHKGKTSSRKASDSSANSSKSAGRGNIFSWKFNFKIPEKLRKLSRTSSSSSDPSIGRARGGRRAAFSAIHFKKEKIMKQLQTGIDKGDVPAIEEVVEYADIAELEDNKMSFVRRASELGNLDVVAVLLRNGATVNLLGDSSSTALHVTAKQGNVPMAAMLLSSGANPNVQAKYEKKTPLQVAVLEGHLEIVRLLIANQADVNQPDIYGSRPIHIASRMGRNVIVSELIDSRASVNCYDNDGWTSLHLACESGHNQTARLLLDNNALIDAQNKYGRTSLHWACVAGQVTVINTLLQRGANANIKDLHKKLPIDYCRTDSLKKLLRRHTADPSESENHFVSTIGFYYNNPEFKKQMMNNNNNNAKKGSNETALSPMNTDTSGSGDQKDEVDKSKVSSEIRELRAKRWAFGEQMSSSLSQTSSTLDIASEVSYHKSYRTSHSNAAVTIIVHPQPKQDLPGFSATVVDREKPDLMSLFQRLIHTATGHLDNVDNSVEELNTIMKLVCERSLELSVDDVKDYMSKLLQITTTLKLLKDSFNLSSETMKNVINDFTSQHETSETGSPNYIALVQLLVQCITDYVSQFTNGWREFLKHLPFPEENRDLLAFQINMKAGSDQEKTYQVIMHWARSCSNSSDHKATYARTLLSSIEKCNFHTETEESSDADHVQNILSKHLDLETTFRSGNSENRSSKLCTLASALTDKEIRHFYNQLEKRSSESDLNVFPVLDELSVSESETETIQNIKASSRTINASSKDIREKLQEKLLQVIEEEDDCKMLIAVKHLIMCGREDLLTCVL